MHLAVDPLVGILRQVFLEALQKDRVDVELGAEGAQLVGPRLLAYPQHLRGDFGCRERKGNGKYLGYQLWAMNAMPFIIGRE